MDRDDRDPLLGSDPADPAPEVEDPAGPGAEPDAAEATPAGSEFGDEPAVADGPDRWFLDGHADLLDDAPPRPPVVAVDRKSTRLNSSHRT